MRVLFGQPERSFYASELIRDAGTGSGAAQRELAKLEGSGLIDLMIISDSLTYGEVFGALERERRCLLSSPRIVEKESSELLIPKSRVSTIHRDSPPATLCSPGSSNTATSWHPHQTVHMTQAVHP